MTLFQLLDSDNENIGLYHIKNPYLSDESAKSLIQDLWEDEDVLLHWGIERVFVTEIHTND